jgi:hypothetical protein
LTIPVVVEPDDEQLFKQARWAPYKSNIDKLVDADLVTTDKELFIYGMFIEWDDSHEHTYKQFSRTVERFRAQYDEYVKIDKHGLVEFARSPRGDMAERIGVAGALTVATKIFGVTEADFGLIPVSSTAKTFDYSLPLHAVGPGFELAVEAKGTHDGKSTRSQILSIREKKAEAKPKKHKAIRFGAVVDFATSAQNESKIVLVDPPEEEGDSELEFERLLLRLHFYLRRLRLLTAQGRLTVALANRISSLRQGNWLSFDKRSLVGARLEELPVDRFPGTHVVSLRPPWRDAYVRMFPLKGEDVGQTVLCYVHGIETHVLQALVVQDHCEILSLRSVPHEPDVVGSQTKFFEPSLQGMESYLTVLPSGVVGGFAYVNRDMLKRKIPDDEDPRSHRSRWRRWG